MIYFWFDKRADIDVVLCSGPWMLDNKLFILKPWSSDFMFEHNVVTSMLMWVKLPNLDLHYSFVLGLSKLASASVHLCMLISAQLQRNGFPMLEF